MKTVMARITIDARERLNNLAKMAGKSASEILTELVNQAAQTVCSHNWVDTSTGSGDDIHARSYCTKCGKELSDD